MFGDYSNFKIYYRYDGLSFLPSVLCNGNIDGKSKDIDYGRIPNITSNSKRDGFSLQGKIYKIHPCFYNQSAEVIELIEQKQTREWSREFSDFKKWVYGNNHNELLKKIDERSNFLIHTSIDAYCKNNRRVLSDSRVGQIRSSVSSKVREFTFNIITKYQNDDYYNIETSVLDEHIENEIFESLYTVILKEILNNFE